MKPTVFNYADHIALQAVLAEVSEERNLFRETLVEQGETISGYASKINRLQSELARVTAERDRAVNDLMSANLCRHCAYDARCGSTNQYRQLKSSSGRCERWEWRGAGKEANHEND